jgi:hypothetical protein
MWGIANTKVGLIVRGRTEAVAQHDATLYSCTDGRVEFACLHSVTMPTTGRALSEVLTESIQQWLQATRGDS